MISAFLGKTAVEVVLWTVLVLFVVSLLTGSMRYGYERAKGVPPPRRGFWLVVGIINEASQNVLGVFNKILVAAGKEPLFLPDTTPRVPPTNPPSSPPTQP